MSAFTPGRSGSAAGRDASLRAEGSGAPAYLRPTDRRHRGGLLTAGLCLAALIALMFSGAAKAETYVAGPTFCAGTGAGAGECGDLRGIAIDESNGMVYAVDITNLRVNQFRSNGAFVRAFGRDVVPGNANTGLEVCTAATGCKIGTTTAPAPDGVFSAGSRGIAVDPQTHIVYIANAATKVALYDGSTGEYVGTLAGTTGGSAAVPPAPEALAITTGVAVDTSDPDQHHLYVAINTDTQSKTAIHKYKVAGAGNSPPLAYVCQITGTELASKSSTASAPTECPGGPSKDGAFNGLRFGTSTANTSQMGGNLAVDGEGNVYISEGLGGDANRQVVSIFEGDGTFLTQFKPDQAGVNPRPEPIAVSPDENGFAPGSLFVGVEGPSGANGGARVHEYDPLDPLFNAAAPGAPLSDFGNGTVATGTGGTLGLAVRSNGVVYATSKTKQQIYGFVPKPAGFHVLAIGDSGAGAGSFLCDTGSGPEICAASYPDGTTVAVEPVPDEISEFSGWAGDCTGVDPCELTLDADKAVTATFGIAQRRLAIQVSGDGEVSSQPPGLIECSTGSIGTCSVELDHGTAVTLVETPSSDLVQAAHWAGCTRIDTPNRCVVSMNADRDIMATFATMLAGPRSEGCANQIFRNGLAALLPNCRAYEMVSPIDKNGGDIETLDSPKLSIGIRESHDQSALDGDGITYSSKTSFGESAQGAPWSSQYLAHRDSARQEWVTRGISPPREGFAGIARQELVVEYKAFSEDLSQAWLIPDSAGLQVGCAPPDSLSLFHRDNVTDTYRVLNCEPIPSSAVGTKPVVLQGTAVGGCYAVFASKAKLTPDANAIVPPAASSRYQLYLSDCDGDLRHISKLPGGANCTDDASAGSRSGPGDGRSHNVRHAFSPDAKRLYWSCGNILLLRQNPDQPESALLHGGANGTGVLTAGSTAVTSLVTEGSTPFAVGQSIFGQGIPIGTMITAVGPGTVTLSAQATASTSANGTPLVSSSPCTEITKACARPIAAGAHFNSAVASDGSKALYTTSSTLNIYDAEEESTSVIAGGALPVSGSEPAGIMGASNDLSRIYFGSTQVLDPKPNSVGRTALAGQTNLYLYDATGDQPRVKFVATLAAIDRAADQSLSGPLHPRMYRRAARVTPDGSHAAFISSGTLTGYDNTDANDGGKVAAEVFLYDATANAGNGSLTCISCNPSGRRPVGGNSNTTAHAGTWIAAQIPGWLTQLYPTRALSDDGSRLFFESYDALLLRDTNGRRDVYEWVRAESSEKCAEIGGELYVPNAGGCISLISSGRSSRDAHFVDADPEGENVFFKTSQSLLPQDPGSVDIYVARVGGGFPPPAQAAECEGDACQGPSEAPFFQTPSSSSASGPGNQNGGVSRRQCGRKQVRRGSRCVAKRALARRSCAARSGDARQRCIANQMRRLNDLQRRQMRTANSNGGAGR